MADNSKNNSIERDNLAYLPDFCNTEVFLRALLVIQLIAITFALISYRQGSFYVHIALISVFMLWVGICVSAVLCAVKRWGWMKTSTSTTIYVFLVTTLVTLTVTFFAHYLTSALSMFEQNQELFYLLLRNTSISIILVGLALRYFYLEFEAKLVLEIQARARLQALQARIRPHFLFNSMNTIASLTHDEPDLAEQSIENLSDLFRASLAAEASVSLEQELTLTRSYIELESLRLGDRLKIDWQIPSPLPKLNLPALTLQPLVENAIYHGIEPIYQGGTIQIRIAYLDGLIELSIVNPVLEDRSLQHRKGNQMAVDNIRERLHLTFGSTATLKLSEIDELFTVTLLLPFIREEEKPA
ncbi:MAG: histidine kinase [Gammaproteobacteria bacterium]|nr:histidine kinase [Gammaproteobacteria bacterium]